MRVDGFNRMHAILGASPACVATHPSDMCVALAALDATVHVAGADGARSLPFEALHRLPGDTPDRETELRPGELIIAVELPALPLARRSTYRKVRDRSSYAFALVSVAAALELGSDGTIRDVRLALGGVAHKPWRAHAAEAVLRGARAGEATFRAGRRGRARRRTAAARQRLQGRARPAHHRRRPRPARRSHGRRRRMSMTGIMRTVLRHVPDALVPGCRTRGRRIRAGSMAKWAHPCRGSTAS